jgi:hypothetical protein
MLTVLPRIPKVTLNMAVAPVLLDCMNIKLDALLSTFIGVGEA